MTINEYLQGLQKLPFKSKDGQTIAEAMGDVAQVWDNDACIGYALAAIQTAALGSEEEQEIIRKLRALFDEMSVEEAKEYAHKWEAV